MDDAQPVFQAAQKLVTVQKGRGVLFSDDAACTKRLDPGESVGGANLGADPPHLHLKVLDHEFYIDHSTPACFDVIAPFTLLGDLSLHSHAEAVDLLPHPAVRPMTVHGVPNNLLNAVP